MKLFEIATLIEKEFPLSDAYEWDNVGLLLGDREKEVKKVLITLDVCYNTATEAIENGVDLIISHHPILFGGTKKITSDTIEGKVLLSLMSNNIAVYAAHTNCDVGKNGINAKLAKLFDLTDVENLEDTGLGRIGNLKNPLTFSEFIKVTKKNLKTPFVRCSGSDDAKISRVAIGSGACSDSIPVAIDKGADVMITADMKYHDMINLTESGISIIDAGHFPTEIIVIDIFENILKNTDLELIKSKNTDIFKIK